MAEQNPESLHDKAKATASPTGPGFVNPGTPEAPLTNMGALTNPTLAQGTSKLQSDLAARNKQ